MSQVARIILLIFSLGISGCFFNSKPPEDKTQISTKPIDKPENGEGYSGADGKGYSGNALLKQVKTATKKTSKKNKSGKGKHTQDWDDGFKFVDAATGKTDKSKLKKPDLSFNNTVYREVDSKPEDSNGLVTEPTAEVEKTDEHTENEIEEDTNSTNVATQIKTTEEAVTKVEELLKETADTSSSSRNTNTWATSVYIKMNGEADGLKELISNRKVYYTGTVRSTGGPFENGYLDYNANARSAGLALPLESLKFEDKDFTIETYFILTEPQMAAMFSILGFQYQGRGCVFDLNYYNLKGQFMVVQRQAPTSSIFPLTISYFEWHHLAASRKNGTIRLYLDGIEFGQIYSPGFATKCANATYEPMLLFSKYGTASYIRVTKGYSRYNSNFLPPGLDQMQP